MGMTPSGVDKCDLEQSAVFQSGTIGPFELDIAIRPLLPHQIEPAGSPDGGRTKHFLMEKGVRYTAKDRLRYLGLLAQSTLTKYDPFVHTEQAIPSGDLPREQLEALRWPDFPRGIPYVDPEIDPRLPELDKPAPYALVQAYYDLIQQQMRQATIWLVALEERAALYDPRRYSSDVARAVRARANVY